MFCGFIIPIMGIRFYCPNGCKVHVKAFQAGRRGICPHCGTSVDIPWQSTRGSSKEKRRPPRSSWEPLSPVSPSDQVAEESGASPEEGNDEEEELATPPLEDGVRSDTLASDLLLTSPPPLPESISTSASSDPSYASLPPPLAESSRPNAVRSQYPVRSPNEPDPLEDATEVIWYVRPPTGGQYGPAGADVMRSWLAEGRITRDSQVWREGWRDWRDAGEVFPEGAFPQLRVSDAVPGLDQVLDSGDSTAATGGRHYGSGRTSVLSQLFIIMVLIALGGGILAAVYVWARFY